MVEFSKTFVKSRKKYYSKSQAKNLLKRLAKTTSDGDFVTLVANVIIREKREDTFGFYFITQNNVRHVVTKEELDEMIVKFVALSKKNNQQHVIDKLKKDLQKFGYRVGNPK